MTGKVNVVELRTRQSLLFEWFHYSWFRSVPNNDEVGFRGEISERNWDLFLDVFADHLDVVLQLGRDGNDGRALGDCALNETQNLKKKNFRIREHIFCRQFPNPRTIYQVKLFKSGLRQTWANNSTLPCYSTKTCRFGKYLCMKNYEPMKKDPELCIHTYIIIQY